MKKTIAGIHNWCDRWCERCTFTSQCAIYENDSDIPAEEKDIRNDAFWRKIGQNFASAQELLRKAAAANGIDIDNLPPEAEESYQRRERIRLESKKHPLATLSLEYTQVAREWLKTQPGMLERIESLKQDLTMGVTSEDDARTEAAVIKDSLEVIRWYSTFIHVKLVRALYEKETDDGWHEENGFQPSFNGSAKIALIAINRSVQAWSALFEVLPDKEDDFLRILAMLQKVRSMAEDEFPNAESFIRPGFDED